MASNGTKKHTNIILLREIQLGLRLRQRCLVKSKHFLSKLAQTSREEIKGEIPYSARNKHLVLQSLVTKHDRIYPCCRNNQLPSPNLIFLLHKTTTSTSCWVIPFSNRTRLLKSPNFFHQTFETLSEYLSPLIFLRKHLETEKQIFFLDVNLQTMKIGKGQKFPQVYCFGNLFDYFNNSFDYFADLFVNVHDVLLHSW